MSKILGPCCLHKYRPNSHLLLVVLLVCGAVQAFFAAASASDVHRQVGVARHHRTRDSILQQSGVLRATRRALQQQQQQQQQQPKQQLQEQQQPQSGSSNAGKSPPELAAAYMDSLLNDPAAARARLCGNFTKRSKVAVVYLCFERVEMVDRAVPAVLRSEGLQGFDFFISQDGGSRSILDEEMNYVMSGAEYVYIHHPTNLCAGLHHYFVKSFAFDIMGYDTLLVVEEDNVVHPQALQLLSRMAELSASEPTIGAVSLLDMDMSAFLDARRFGAGIIPTAGAMGHLWVFGLHRSKYGAVRGHLRDYYEVIKGHDYRAKHEPPLKDAIEGLMRAKAFPMPTELSQDRWFINSLAAAGFTRRYQTLFRFFEPIGHYGLHFRLDESHFYNIFGRQMFTGRIDPASAFDVTKNPAHLDAIYGTVRARMTELCARYWGGLAPPEVLVNNTFGALLDGRLNGMEAVRDTMQGPSPPKPPRPPPPPSPPPP